MFAYIILHCQVHVFIVLLVVEKMEDKMKWAKNYERVQEIARQLSWPPVTDLDPRVFIPEVSPSFFFLNPCSKSYDFWFYELMRRMFLFPYLLQYLKSTLIKQPCDRLLAACADRQLLHEGQLTLIGSYNSYVNRSKISKFYRCGSQCQQVQSYTYVGYNKFKIDTNLSSFHTIKVYASV